MLVSMATTGKRGGCARVGCGGLIGVLALGVLGNMLFGKKLDLPGDGSSSTKIQQHSEFLPTKLSGNSNILPLTLSNVYKPSAEGYKTLAFSLNEFAKMKKRKCADTEVYVLPDFSGTVIEVVKYLKRADYSYSAIYNRGDIGNEVTVFESNYQNNELMGQWASAGSRGTLAVCRLAAKP